MLTVTFLPYLFRPAADVMLKKKLMLNLAVALKQKLEISNVTLCVFSYFTNFSLIFNRRPHPQDERTSGIDLLRYISYFF